MKADIGLIGLAVMGQNLVLNMDDHGYTVAVYNRSSAKVTDFVEGPAKGTKVVGSLSLKEFFSTLKRPRKVIFMVKAGSAVDDLIKESLPFLEEGDILIDGGNSLFVDSERRVKELEEKGILFVGAGISGGEEGARRGPSIMPGGNAKAWPHIKEIFQKISAKAPDGLPCCDWVGSGGSGHYVKMVHNGIEYGDMQLICEAYALLKGLLKRSPSELSTIFTRWNKGDLSSYLIEISADIFGFKEGDGFLVDKILDVAGQKGTGKWTGISALDLGVPVTLIGQAVFARCLSSIKDERVEASKIIKRKISSKNFGSDFEEKIGKALFCSKIISYAQGFMLMQAKAEEMGWQLNFAAVAHMWKAGCIIRSGFLGNIEESYKKNKGLKNLLLADFFRDKLAECESSFREVVAEGMLSGVPIPCFAAALSFYDGYCESDSSANLLQAQRDYFGAHTYERKDQPRGTFFHTNWTGKGGNVSSSTYNA